MAMALKWLLHSTSYLLGSPIGVLGYGNEGCSKGENGSAPGFQMPVHYPRYARADYRKMEEWKVDQLLKEYGLSFHGSLEEKRDFAMGTFVWPDQF